MNIALKNKILSIFVRNDFSPEDARFVSDILQEMDDIKAERIEMKKELFLTQSDKLELIEKISEVKISLTRSIYVVGLVQFMAIVASVLAIIKLAF